MAKKEEEVVEKEYSLHELLAHSRTVDANIIADQTMQAREAVKAQWGLTDPSETTPVVTKPATKKELADQQKAFDIEKKDLEARLLESQNANVDLAKQVESLQGELSALRAQLSSSSTKTDEEAAAGAAAKLAQQSGDEPPPWLQGEQK